MPDTVSADHIAEQGGAFEPQRKANFTLYIDLGANIGGHTRILQRSLNSCPLPKEGNEEIAVNYGNEVRKVAGRATYDDLELVLKDFVDQQIAKIMINWRRVVYNPNTGAIGYARDYKREGELIMFGPDGVTAQRRWRLMGVWPKKIDPGGGDMNVNENNVITTTLAIDKAIEQF